MSHAQKYLAQANRHIAELKVQMVRQRVIVKDALGTGQRSEMAESLLDALEGSLRLFEKHRVLILGQLQLEYHHCLFTEGHFRSREIEFPHADKALVVELLD